MQVECIPATQKNTVQKVVMNVTYVKKTNNVKPEVKPRDVLKKSRCVNYSKKDLGTLHKQAQKKTHSSLYNWIEKDNVLVWTRRRKHQVLQFLKKQIFS